MIKLLALGLFALGAWIGYQKLTEVKPESYPAPASYPVGSPPDVNIKVPVP